MLKISNLDSKLSIDFNEYDQDRIIANIGILSTKMDTPIYLVNTSTMDSLYPPQKKVLFNEECLKKVLGEFLENYSIYEDDFFDIFAPYSSREHRKKERKNDESEKEGDNDLFKECQQKIGNTLSVAVGLYVKNYQESPAIFITPERCEDWANDLNIPTMMVFEMVLYHELAHAYLDNTLKSKRINYCYYNTWWGKLLEESFANTIALNRFNGFFGKEKSAAIKIINSQPLEYRGALIFANRTNNCFSEAIRNPRLWRHYKHLRDVRRYFDHTFPFSDQFLPQPIHWKTHKFSNSSEKFWKMVAIRVMLELL